MGYAPCNSCYSAASAMRLEQAVNKFYINGDVHINNGSINQGIQHTIAAQRTGDVHVYSQSIDNRVGVQQVNYVLNMDNRKVEFVSPYIGGEGRHESGYDTRNSRYLLSSPPDSHDNSQASSYQQTITSGLLKPKRPLTQFVESAEEIEGIVRETFEKLTGQEFPDDIVVRVLAEEEMKRAHKANGGKWSPGIMGFALNRAPYPSAIFVRKNHLDALMLTVGHELGHVLSERLPNELDEEAKAFAFELAWTKCIIKNDIGGLAANFNADFMPAANGLHDRAFAFVQSLVRKGKEALKVFWEIAKGAARFDEKAFI
ncbi:hypothetical protein JW898_02580 [Candidatus Woesearchaeota archaeon]|nr:hypothetical protein [Candidatus Woesearchaeota archaeon]